MPTSPQQSYAAPLPTSDRIADACRKALELSRRGAPVQESLGTLIHGVEAEAGGGVLCSILLLDAERKVLRHGAGPSLPADYNQAIDGIAIGPTVGSCGTAAFGGHTVTVFDIATDPLWADFKELALRHGLRACWSTPIRSSGGEILGTFALYHRAPAAPTVRDREVVDGVAKVAAQVIERHRTASA